MQNINFDWMRGDDEREVLLIEQGGAPFDLTGYRADLHIRPEEGSPVELSTGNGLTIENHKITIEIAHEKTKNAEWRAAPWDLQLTTPEGRVKTICGGIVRLRQDITR